MSNGPFQPRRAGGRSTLVAYARSLAALLVGGNLLVSPVTHAQTLPAPADFPVDSERCAIVAALAKAKLSEADGVVSAWEAQFNDPRLDRCDWKALGVIFTKLHDAALKDLPCAVWGGQVNATGAMEKVCLERAFDPYVTIDWPEIGSDRTARRCDGPGGWCWDTKLSASVYFLWVRASLYGGGEICDFDKIDGRWTLKACRSAGPAI